MSARERPQPDPDHFAVRRTTPHVERWTEEAGITLDAAADGVVLTLWGQQSNFGQGWRRRGQILLSRAEASVLSDQLAGFAGEVSPERR